MCFPRPTQQVRKSSFLGSTFLQRAALDRLAAKEREDQRLLLKREKALLLLQVSVSLMFVALPFFARDSHFAFGVSTSTVVAFTAGVGVGISSRRVSVLSARV